MDILTTIIEAAVDASRKTAGAPAAPSRPGVRPGVVTRGARPGTPAQAVPAASPAAAAPPAPQAAVAPEQPAAPGAGVLALFQDGNSLLRAVIASEILAPPVALREPARWSPPPNEPST